MIDQVGRYPFDIYGVEAADQRFAYARETQTLSLHPAFLFQAPRPPSNYEPVMVHELAHQWFGDSVAPVRWQDVWLNEGHADYYEKTYAAQFYGFRIVDYWHAEYQAANQLRHDYGPVAKPTGNDIFTLFSDNVYGGGSLALYALRQVAGERTFSEIERTWVARYKDESVSTEQPPMPGHPDWTSAAPTTTATAARSAVAAPSARPLELGIYKR